MTRFKLMMKSFFLSLFVLVCGVSFSGFVAWKSATWIQTSEDERFITATKQTTLLIRNKLNENVQLLHSAVAFLTASDYVSREEWHFFTQEHTLETSFIGQEGLAYAPRIKINEHSQHEQRMQAEGLEQYQIHPKTSNADAYPIVFIEPFNDRNKRALGFDLFSEKTRQHAIEEAILKGDVAISSKIELVQRTDSEERAGFVLFHPIYARDMLFKTSEKYNKAPIGIVSLAMNAQKLFTNVLGARYITLDFEIYDGDTLLETQKLYDSNPSMKIARLERNSLIDIYGKHWTLHFKANKALDLGISQYIPWIELLIGITFSFILAGWIYALQQTQKKAYAIAAEKTKLLAKSESEIRSIFQTMQEGILVLNDAGMILECNLAAQEMLQLSKSEIIGNFSSDSKWKAVHEDGLVFELEERPFYKALHTGEPQNNIIMGIKRGDGTYVWVKANAQPIYSDDFEKINSVLITFSDITAYRKSKYELEKYLQIIDMHVIISSTDLHGIITEVSKAFCEISGYTKEELIGKSHNIVRHPDIPSSIYKEMWDTLEKGISWSGEIKNRCKDGSDYWIETIIEPRYNEEYKMVGYTAICHDITDKKRVEELSITDRLTGLYNRLKLDELFASYLSIAKRHQTPFSIILLDIDKFKSVNDTYGHQVGDSLLQELAKLLKTNVRFEDAVGRWGGEEFLILLPNSDLESARLLAEKLRSLMETQNFAYVGRRTSSFGVASYHLHDDEKSMTARADAALYLAKENGRNRVEIETYMCTLPAF